MLVCVTWALLPDGTGSEFCLTKRWRSSTVSSSSSESSASKASARAGSLTRRLRGVLEEAREWKEGGGEDGGIDESGLGWCVLETWSSSSWALTWCR